MTKQLIVPEVLQSSLMDCGPAALMAVLAGFGIEANYDALRERCQTDVDGTSIDALARLGAELGLKSYELLVPRDSFLLPEANCLPAIVVSRSGGGQLHFNVIWSRLGPWVQMMDPASGRRWVHAGRVLEHMPDLPIPISAKRWRRWAESPDGLSPLHAKLRRLGVRESQRQLLVERAASDTTWYGFAALDAAVRMISNLVETRALPRGRAAARLIEGVLARALQLGASQCEEAIPKRFWWATMPKPEQLVVRGSVIVHFSERVEQTANSAKEPLSLREHDLPPVAAPATNPALPATLRAPSASGQPQPLRWLWQIARYDAPGALWVACAALCLCALLVPIEAVLLRSMLDVQRFLALEYQRGVAAAALLALIAVGLGCEWIAAGAARRVGLGLELRLRVALLHKLPRLPDRYLQSRTSSDFASRGHTLHVLRDLPRLGAQALRAVLTMSTTTCAIVWLWPGGLWPACLAAVSGLTAPWLLRRSMAESNTRLRTHAAALDRFYLDALLGVSPISAHGAERAVRKEHESLLTEWARTASKICAQSTGLQLIQAFSTTLICVALVGAYVAERSQANGLLLLAFLALRVPSAAQDLVFAQVSYRSLRSVLLRVLSPLSAAQTSTDARAPQLPTAKASALQLCGVTVQAGGHSVLNDLSLEISAGSHVAIVGASGAGKSSLLGLLLGWLTPAQGQVRVDDVVLDAHGLPQLRAATAWLDPGVRIWDRSLYDNLTFGDDSQLLERLPQALEHADLTEVLSSLPDGMQTSLGEGGVRLSGGQGQRVRLGRALMRSNVRLALFDEPFRGLQRDKRRALLARTRIHFAQSTLLFVSHDVSDTLDFDRVLVLADGRVVEDGKPSELLAKPESRFGALVHADRALRTELWSSARWQRRILEDGSLAPERAP
jgi:ATP-binding cassette subfamily B protein